MPRRHALSQPRRRDRRRSHRHVVHEAVRGIHPAPPSAITILGYAIAFYFLSLTLREIPTGIAYAIWSGVGIVLIAAIAWAFQGQKLDLPAILGMALIIAGVLVLNLFSGAAAH